MRQAAQKQLLRVNSLLEGGDSKNDSFLSGKLGLIFYYFHLYRVTGESYYNEMGDKLLENVFRDLNSGHPRLIGASFSSGGSGLGYVMNFLNEKNLVAFDVESEFVELDQFLFEMAFHQMEEDFIDYLHGALGVVHYFSERKPSPVIDDYLDRLVGKLFTRVIMKDAGYWFRNYFLKVDEDKESINFGLAHGLSGILLILLKVYHRSSHKEMIKKIVLEGIRFIRKYKMDIDFSNEEYSFFPFIIKTGANEISAPNRLGWCYGDLNEVLLFYRAGKLFDDNELIDVADVIGSMTIMRKDAVSTLVADSNFCHGTSGLAQFYRKIYDDSGLEMYKEAYEYWIGQTIVRLDKDLEDGIYAGKEHDMLDGLIGVAFSLLSYVSDRELDWSRSLLL